MHTVPCVPTFELCLERDGASLALDVPCSFTAARYERLVAFLDKEHFTVTASASATAFLAGCSEREVHAAELVFIRQLGKLRTRGVAVPEKTVGKLLGIGVKALHARCEQLFACKWAEFLGQQASSSQSSPCASSQPSADEEVALCPAAAPSMTAAEQPAVLPAPAATAATAAPSAATAATLEPLLASCFLAPDQEYEEQEQYDVLSMLLGPCQAPAAAAGHAVPAATATATTSCGCCATGVCGCDELESVFSAGQPVQQQQQWGMQQQQWGMQLPAAPEYGAYFPPTPAAAPLPLAPATSAATVQQLPPVQRLSSSLVRFLAEMEEGMQEPPYFDAAPATPAALAAPAAPAAPAFDAVLTINTPEFPIFPIPRPADPLNLSSATVADFPFFFL